MVRASALILLALPLAAVTSPAAAQVSDEIVLNILRNCAQIDDPTARLACYDNNIRAAGGDARISVPGAMPTPDGGRGGPLDNGRAGGFGAEDIRTPQRFESAPGQVDEIRARVTSVTERQRGVYLIALENGAQWLFTESVPFAYRPPRPGDTVDIDRASLGSFLLTFDSQRSVRVERVQ
ncbi:hypothetical protein GRI62_05785 [Erythrobacter arachoides]|uniref:Uncharacterized protein n=1 Tax=Aurantiacibacter arachoides TaxID=1850444 RepID=A0A845A1V3_9SPHN|nr:hypothetical protein [Aurantiacibacter arachoides]MXO93116.1 hypothetical protein [Aurantiacibacter arachoides]GGD51909.1 hypothetical protein GCM10011411_09690 [Aurantiacibacter arachoides]